jgi:hypothetical protein
MIVQIKILPIKNADTHKVTCNICGLNDVWLKDVGTFNPLISFISQVKTGNILNFIKETIQRKTTIVRKRKLPGYRILALNLLCSFSSISKNSADISRAVDKLPIFSLAEIIPVKTCGNTRGYFERALLKDSPRSISSATLNNASRRGDLSISAEIKIKHSDREKDFLRNDES